MLSFTNFAFLTLNVILLSLVLKNGLTLAADGKPPNDPRCLERLPKYLADLDGGRKPAPLPAPLSSLPVPTRDVGYNLEEVRPGAYAVLAGGYISIIILRGKHLVLIDFPDPIPRDPATPTTAVMARAALEVLNGTQPSKIDMIYTHSHFDHIGTASLTKSSLSGKFPSAKFRFWASKGTASSILQSGSKKAPAPTRIFRRQALLRIGDYGSSFPVLLGVIGGHTEDDVFVYLRPSRELKGVMFAVDLTAPGWAPFFELDLSQNIRQYLAAQDALTKFDYEVFVGGHATRAGSKADVVFNKNFALSVINAAEKALPSVPSFGVVAQRLGVFDPKSSSFGNIYAGIGDYYDAVDGACARKVIEEWGCRLASVDAVAKSCCTAARLFFEIDK